jgi:hypothetical protein
MLFVSALKELGVTSITICDAHDKGDNIIRSRFNLGLSYPEVIIVSQLWNIDFGDGFDFAMLTGFHGMNGKDGILPHTWRPDVEKATVNDIEIGEVGILIKWLREKCVPVIFVCGDDASISEALAVKPNIDVFSVKRLGYIPTDEDIYRSLKNAISEAVKKYKFECALMEKYDRTEIKLFLINNNLLRFVSNKNAVRDSFLLYNNCSELISAFPLLCEDLNRASSIIINENILFIKQMRDEFWEIDIEDYDNAQLKQTLSKNIFALTDNDKEYIYTELKKVPAIYRRRGKH